MNQENETKLSGSELEMLRNDKIDGYKYRERRADQWTENYTLYRDTVIYNRLTQRQTVNVPMMKMSLRTLLSQYDDIPVISFEELSNDEEKQTFLNEYWKWTGEINKFEIKDLVDKKQEQFYGRSYDQWQIIDGMVKQTIISPEDILVSRFVDPTNIHSSRFLYHIHIFMPLTSLQSNPDYNQKAVSDLEAWFKTDMGLIKQSENEDSYQDKMQKMVDLGLEDSFEPILGETIVELSQCFRWEKARDGQGEEIYLYVVAQDQQILLKKALEEILDPNGNCKDHYWRYHYPYTSWAGDVDMQDWYTDGAADIVRMSNKVLNTWYSQEVENRTMKNMNMNYYNGAIDGAENFAPQTFEPKAWGWYKLPGKPNEVVMPVGVQDLGDTLDDMRFIMDINERATGSVSSLQGAPSQRQITLGEVKIDLSQAQERIKGISKLYNQVWKERAELFLKLIEANPDRLDAVKIYKKGRSSDKIYSRLVEPTDWRSEAGYQVKIWSQVDKNNKDTQALEKWNAVKGNMPNNPIVDDIYKRKLLEFAEAKPEEVVKVMEFEKQQTQGMQQQATMGGAMTPGQPTTPQTPMGGMGQEAGLAQPQQPLEGLMQGG